jgi:hypothetical protein
MLIFGRCLRWDQLIACFDASNPYRAVVFPRSLSTGDALRNARGAPIVGPEHDGPQIGALSWVEADPDGLRFTGDLWVDVDLPARLSVWVNATYQRGPQFATATALERIRHVAICETGACPGTWWKRGPVGMWPMEPLATPHPIALGHAHEKTERILRGTHG